MSGGLQIMVMGRGLQMMGDVVGVTNDRYAERVKNDGYSEMGTNDGIA